MGITFKHQAPLDIKNVAYEEGKKNTNDRSGLERYMKELQLKKQNLFSFPSYKTTILDRCICQYILTPRKSNNLLGI